MSQEQLNGLALIAAEREIARFFFFFFLDIEKIGGNICSKKKQEKYK
jgi:hypothetical protein